jgi:hypothetical protein
MVWPVDPAVLAALLTGDVAVDVHVSVISPHGAADVPLLEQSVVVSASLGRTVGRTAVLGVDRSSRDAVSLNIKTDHVYVRVAIRGGGPDIPLFTGRANTAVETDHGDTVLNCVDPADDLVNNDFVAPWSTVPHNTVAREMRAIIVDSDPSFSLDSSQLPNVEIPLLSWATSRQQALDDLVGQVNGLWQANRTGGFITYVNPYALTGQVLPVLTLQDGVNGTLVTARETRDRSNIYNAITLISENPNGDQTQPPLRITVYDNNPLSDTRFGGPFGRRNKTISVQQQVITTQAALTQLAVRKLRQSLALQRSFDITCPFMPVLDQGDVIAVEFNGEITAQVVQQVDTATLATTATRVTTRELFFQDLSNLGSF